MPDRIFGTDVQLSSSFTAEDLTGVEYAEGHYVAVTCKICHRRWGLEMGEMGEVPAAARNPLIAHLQAHSTKGVKKRGPIFALPSA